MTYTLIFNHHLYNNIYEISEHFNSD